MTLTLIWRGGAEGWVEIRGPQGRWWRTYGHCVGALVEEAVQGGHWVEDVPPSPRQAAAADRRRQRAKG